MFSLICARINGSVNNCQAGDLRRHRAHYDVTVMGRQTTSPITVLSFQGITRTSSCYLGYLLVREPSKLMISMFSYHHCFVFTYQCVLHRLGMSETYLTRLDGICE